MEQSKLNITPQTTPAVKDQDNKPKVETVITTTTATTV